MVRYFGHWQARSGSGESRGFSSARQTRDWCRRVSALTAFVAIATFAPAASASASATPQSWGANPNGELCNGTGITTSPPNDSAEASGVGLPAGLSVKAVAAGNTHSLFLMADGSVWACGSDGSGQLGALGVNGQNTVTMVTGLPKPAIAIAASTLSSMALLDDGTVWTWGDDTFGELGNGIIGAGGSTPVEVIHTSVVKDKPLTNVIAIAAGANHGVALQSDGTVWSWGDNQYGQLCHNTGGVSGALSSHAVSALTPGGSLLSGVKAISANVSDDSLLLTDSGGVFGCGRNSSGQLGIGSTINEKGAVQVLAGAQGAGNLKSVKAVSAGEVHSLALLDNGTVMSWGDNTVGELSCTAPNPSLVPGFVLVSGCAAKLSGVIAIAAGGWPGAPQYLGIESAALMSNGEVQTWGDNTYGNLGDCSTASSAVPVVVDVGSCTPSPTILTGVTAISVGGGHTFAVT